MGRLSRLKCGAYVALVLNVFLLIALVAITCLKIGHDNRGRGAHQQHQDQMSQSVNQSLLIAINGDHTTEVEKIHRELSSFYGTKKASAHLAITSPYNSTANLVTLNWQHAPEMTFLEKGMDYEDGAIIVTHGGYYFVYTQIRYFGSGTEELNYGRIIHNVLMQKDSEKKETPTILMQNLQSTPTIRRGRLAFTTSSLGATFYLDSNARVMVNSSIPKNIDSSPYGSYFGIFLI